MNKMLRTLVILSGVFTLSACAACPREGDYNRVPYGNRTAGEGVAIYDGNCRRVQETVQPVRVQQQQRVETREPVRSAEPVFEQRMRK